MMEKMINTMMKRYQMFAWLGILIVLIAFVVALQGANANTAFFGVDKVTRETAEAGSALVAANVARHTIPFWVPSFKFLGLGILLGAITMALGMIATTLRNLGTDVMSKWPADLNPGTPPKPRSAKMFPMIMMMGWMVLIIGFIWALASLGTVSSYWNHSIVTELNPATAGSALLNQLRTIQATLPWLGVLRFGGMSLLFTGITVALTVIIRTLQHQEQVLRQFVQVHTSSD
ncbi:MAG: hypothetical protein GY796_23360 [Chloroflexi bacterium]|nr:hypothetical protein [Chloroflexota bacterium]